MKVLSAEINLETPTNLGNSTVVRVYNSDSSAGTITKKDVAGNTLGTITVPSGEVVYCEKKYTDTLEGGVTLKASQIAYSNMMYYASAAAGGPDTTNPTLSSSSPANNATLVEVDSNIVLNFSEPVDAESGNIVIYKESDDSVIETIDVTSGQVTGSGTNQITINPSSDLTSNTTFYIQIAATAFDDASGNSYAGISDKTSLRFSTAPDYVTDNLVFHIDASDTNSYSGSGTTVNSLVGSITNSSYNPNIIHSTDDGGYWRFGTLSFSPRTNNGIEFDSITNFMPLGSNDITFECWVRKVGGTFNGLFSIFRILTNGNEMPGFNIKSYNDIVFVSKDNPTDPDTATAVYTPLSNNAYPYGAWHHVVASHDTSAGQLKIYVDGIWINTSDSIDTTNWSSYHNNATDSYIMRLGYSSNGYYLNGDISIVRFYKGKALTASEVMKNYNAEKERYPAPDTTNPTLSSSSPANNATGVALDSNIILNFSEIVYVRTGNIRIKKTSDDSIVESIDVRSNTIVTGSGTNQITIIRGSDLPDGETFYITISSTAFDDVSGNSYAGISDKTSLSFTTVAYVTDNLVFHIDAGDTNSYSGSGTTVNSLVGNITSSSYNSNISHSTSDGGYWTFGATTGDGIEFDSITSFMPLGSNDMTYEIWVYKNAYTNTNYGSFVLTRNKSDGTSRTSFATQFYRSTVVGDALRVYKSGSYNAQATAGYNSSNVDFDFYDFEQWNHIVFSHDISAGRPKFYYNGSEIPTSGSGTWDSYFNNSTDQYQLNVGTNLFTYPGGYQENHFGRISILRIYKGKALTASEVYKNYNAEKGRYYSIGNAAYVTDNLDFHIDAGDTNSYSGSGTTVNSLVGNITSSSYNSNINHSTSDGGYWTFASLEVAGPNDNTGTGIEFNSITSFMPLGSNIDITFEFWMRRTAGDFNGPFSIVRTLAGGAQKAGIFTPIYQTTMYVGKDNATTPDTGNPDYISSLSNTISTNTWQHIVGSHDTSAGQLKIYVNGTWNNSIGSGSIDTTNWSGYHHNATDSYLLRVGDGGLGYIMNGDISIVRFYKGKALTASEVTQNFNAEKARYGYS